MEVQTSISFTGIFFLSILLAAIVLIASKVNRRTLAVLFGSCIVVVLGMLTLWRFTYTEAPAGTPFKKEMDALRVHKTTPTVEAPNESTLELWEHLTRNRIDLSDTSIAAEALSEDSDRADEKETTPSKKPRPDWIDTPPKRVGNVYREVIVSDLYSTTEECHRALEQDEFRTAVRNRTRQLTGTDKYPGLETLGLDIGYVLSEICLSEWVESVESPSAGEMKRVHVLMEFNAAVDERLRNASRDYLRKDRIAKVGGFAGLGLGSLALLFGLLKADTYTRGYYTKRLFFGVPAAIIAVVALLV